MNQIIVNIGETVLALDAEKAEIECKVVYRYLLDGVPSVVLVPAEGGYSFSRSMDELCPIVRKAALRTVSILAECVS